jgi:hypothetical protein
MNSNAIQIIALGLIGITVLCTVACMYLVCIHADIKKLLELMSTFIRVYQNTDERNKISANKCPFQRFTQWFINKLKQYSSHDAAKQQKKQ